MKPEHIKESWYFLGEKGIAKKFRLAEEVNRVDSTTIPLSKREEEEVQRILEKNICISLHDHTIVFPEKPEEYIPYIRSGRWWIGYHGLKASGLNVVFDGMLDGIALIRSPDPWDWDNVVHQIGMIRADIDRHRDIAMVIERLGDIKRVYKEGKIGFVIHLEGPPRIGEDIDKVDILYGLGVRCIGVTYSRGNEFGSGLADKVDRGLTDLGHEFIDRMNRLGIAIDLAHVGDKTSLDVIEYSREPVFITHAGARSLWPTKRMKPDEVIQALADKGGVFGVEAAPHTTLTENHIRHSIESVMEHFQYIEKLVGIDYVAFGPDTIFGDHVGLHKIFMEYLAITDKKDDRPRHPMVEYVDGLENPSQFMNIIRWMVKNGYSEGEISKAIGKNIIRVLNRVWK